MKSYSIWPISTFFLGAFAYSRKGPIIFVIYVCPPACISVTPNRQIFVKFDIENFHENLSKMSVFYVKTEVRFIVADDIK